MVVKHIMLSLPLLFAPLRALRDAGLDPAAAKVRDLTAQQLGTLHLGGREGLRVPTFKQFLE